MRPLKKNSKRLYIFKLSAFDVFAKFTRPTSTGKFGGHLLPLHKNWQLWSTSTLFALVRMFAFAIRAAFLRSKTNTNKLNLNHTSILTILRCTEREDTYSIINVEDYIREMEQGDRETDEVNLLKQRLTKAEKRLRLLKAEIDSIKASLQARESNNATSTAAAAVPAVSNSARSANNAAQLANNTARSTSNAPRTARNRAQSPLVLYDPTEPPASELEAIPIPDNVALFSKQGIADFRRITHEVRTTGTWRPFPITHGTAIALIRSGVLTESDIEQPKRARTTSDVVDISDENDWIIVYADGSCENNGRPYAKAGVGVWFGHNHAWNVSKPVIGRATNNTAEIQACIAALEVAGQHGVRKLKIKTDSQFVINCVLQWMPRWKVNNWRTSTGGAVKNRVDLERLDSVLRLVPHVSWEHVNGHVGVTGNEEADRLARAGAERYVAS